MRRLWFVLALALSLWPSAASASPGVSGAGPDGPDVITHADSPYGHELLRSEAGLELIRSIQSRDDDGLDEVGGATHLLSGHERLALRLGLRVRPPSDEGADPCTPLCERLPYHATAPPARR